MKKNILVILTLATIIALTGCGDKTSNNLDGEKKQSEEKVVNIQEEEFNLDLVGMELETAKNLVEEAGFKIGDIEEKVNFDCNPGVVLLCTPNKGDLTSKGQSVNLVVNKEIITIEEGLELVKRTVETASINQESKIGDKTYYFYSNGRPGDSVTCLDPVTREILHYYSDGALLNSKGEIITKQKADWQK